MTEQVEKQPFWDVLGLPAPGTPMSDTAFNALPEVNIPIELVNGIVAYPHWNEDTMTAAPILNHQTVVLNVVTWLKIWSRQHGGTPFVSPVDVWLSDALHLQPDVVWLAATSRCAQTESHLKGAPELVVEVLSPSTARRDRTEKFDLYERHGVGEYWIIDPRDKLVEVYFQTDLGFRRQGGYGPMDTFASAVLAEPAIPVREFFAL